MEQTSVAPVNPHLPGIWYGGDYNPDQWPAEMLDRDVELMQEAGVSVVSLGVFSWSQLEPKEGQYTFDWMDRAFDKLHTAGVSVALATPSAAPPRWMSSKYPEILAVANDGRRLLHGERQRFCPTIPLYREKVEAINSELARRYGSHPGLVMWHVSNEYVARCHCELCREGFIQWLQDRYADLDELNSQYWSAFWSHRFTDWSQIAPPRNDTARVPHNLRLDWQRFQSIRMCEFFKFEADILRKTTPNLPITTNLMGQFKGLNYAHFALAMDVVSWDCYGSVEADPVQMAFDHSLMRGMKPGRPWLLLEQTPSATNWQHHATLKPPGMLRRWSWQAIGHGSDSVMYFQWRRSRGGPEKFHGSVVEHEGSNRPRVFQESAQLGRELKAVGEKLMGTTALPARIGVLADQETRWAFEEFDGFTRDRAYFPTLIKHFRALWSQHYAVDVVQYHADFSSYDLLIAPQLYMVPGGVFPRKGTEEEEITRVDLAGKLSAFVEQGGSLVLTWLSGIVNENDLVMEGGYPGSLRKLAGVWVEETDCRPAGQKPNQLKPASAFGRLTESAYPCDRFFDRLHAEQAQVLATYSDNWYAGEPCLTENRFGKGKVYYLGTDAEPAFLEPFYATLADAQGIQPLARTSEHVELLLRSGSGRRILIALNHGGESATIELIGQDASGQELISDRSVTGSFRLEAGDVAVVELL